MELHIWVLYSINPDSFCEGEVPKGLSGPQKTSNIKLEGHGSWDSGIETCSSLLLL